jgi:hypothetical protein
VVCLGLLAASSRFGTGMYRYNIETGYTRPLPQGKTGPRARPQDMIRGNSHVLRGSSGAATQQQWSSPLVALKAAEIRFHCGEAGPQRGQRGASARPPLATACNTFSCLGLSHYINRSVRGKKSRSHYVTMQDPSHCNCSEAVEADNCFERYGGASRRSSACFGMSIGAKCWSLGD